MGYTNQSETKYDLMIIYRSASVTSFYPYRPAPRLLKSALSSLMYHGYSSYDYRYKSWNRDC